MGGDVKIQSDLDEDESQHLKVYASNSCVIPKEKPLFFRDGYYFISN